ncbi:hypothetical protein FRC05_005696 [Tulasnella sp. 425]|nr:hypothetical protein FRC05_005696 [Tulasnella sp. 425]
MSWESHQHTRLREAATESISSSTRVSLANGTLIESSLSVEDEDEDESDGKDEVEVEDLKGELDSDDDDESKELGEES